MDILFWIVAIIVVVGIFVLMQVSQSKQINKVEKEELEPILESLYKEPKSTSKHQQFMQGLRTLDEKINEYRGDGYVYTPSNSLLGLLLQHLDKYTNDSLAHERFMGIVARAHQVSEFGFQKLTEHLEKYSDNPSVRERFAQSVTKSKFLSNNTLVYLIRYLEKYPTDPSVQAVFMQGITKLLFPSIDTSQTVYSEVLEILEKNPDNISAKKLVLDVGRWHFGKLRGGQPTIYDEQAIQNDISVRSNR